MMTRSRQEFHLGIGVLVVLQLVTAFAAIGLTARMTPAIAKILGENEFTIEVAEEMLLALARRTIVSETSTLASEYRAALERAMHNITEPGESEVLARLEQNRAATWQGDAEALRRSIEGLRELIEINRRALLRADREARRLGTAGGWAAAFLAMAGFAASVLVSRRLSARILDPLEELHDVTEAWHRGDHFRRCRVLNGGPEMRRVLESTNALLDDHFRGRRATSGGGAG
jgi:hypothetical protein